MSQLPDIPVKNFVGIPSVYPQLLELRKSKTAKFKQNEYLKDTTKLRYYQVIGSLHLMLLERMVLGDGTGLGKCVSEDTYINTSIGLIKIKDLIKDFMQNDHFYPLPDYIDLLSINKIKKPTSIYVCGKKNGLKIISNNGFEILGLRHHPILAAEIDGTKYKQLSDLRIGDYICINRNSLFSNRYVSIPNYEIIIHELSQFTKTYESPGYLNEELSELFGFFISEGNSSTETALTITQFDKEINSRIRVLLKKCFNYKENSNVKSYNESIKIHSTHIVHIFKKLGINILDKSADKIIPWSILQSPQIIIQSFLKGYFEGDGCVEISNKGISCCSKSEELIKQIQLCLLNFGIISKRKKKMIKVKDERRPYWILYFFGKNVDIFAHKIGFISSRKKKELQSILSKKRNTNLDIIPFGKILLNKSMNDIIKHLKSLPDQKGFSIRGSGWKGLVGYKYKRIVESYTYGKRTLTYEGLKKFIETVEQLNLSSYISNMDILKNIIEENIFFDKIIDISWKKSRFIDFHIPDTHNFTGNGFINHNTVQAIAAYSWLLKQDPTLKILIVTPKSALFQWQEEFEKFSQNITVRIITNEYKGLTGYGARTLQYQEFKENVLIINYDPLINEYEAIKDILSPNFMMVLDEVTAIKNRKTQRHFACKYLSGHAKRAYGLSATIIKNGLEEVYCIYDVIVPGLFGKITKFKNTYCDQKLIKLRINNKDRWIPKIIGYKNLKLFKDTIDPYFLIRRKEEVAEELPKLISRKIVLEMLPDQKELYRQALSGIFYEEKIKNEYYEISDRIRNGINDEKTIKRYNDLKEKYEKFLTPDGKKRGKLAALTYCQMISNGPALLNQPGESSKEEEFLRLMKDELLTDKVILFTRFKSGIPTLEIICEHNRIKYTKITGDQNDRERTIARHSFQDDPNCNLIFITTAGSAALNLQAASALIFYDTPWSYGDLAQTIGRAQRIGSLREHILILHMVNKGTIDIRVINRVTEKKDLSDIVLGDTAEGALDFTAHEDNVIEDLYSSLLQDAEKYQIKG